MNSRENKGFGLLFEMGCGKTLTAIAIAGALYKADKIRRLLIVAPTTVVSVWASEFEQFADFEYSVAVLLGAKASRLTRLGLLQRSHGLQVAAINYESVFRDGISEALTEFDADMIICDESQRIKNPKADASKKMHELGDAARYKLILTGTPLQNNAMDVWSQYRFLDRTIFGDNFWKFRGRYAKMGGFKNKQIVGYNDLDDLIQKTHSIAFRVTKEDALDLPEQTFEKRRVPLSAKTQKLYNELKRESYVALDNGDEVSVTTVLTQLLRLQQLTGGFLKPDDKTEPEQVSSEKLDALKDIIEDYVISTAVEDGRGWHGGKKLVVFARFLSEVKAIAALAEKLLGKKGLKAVCVYGEVPKQTRGELIEQFQTDENTVVFVGQIDTAGTGITLTAADTCVYYSKTFNYATYEQSLSRIHRIGQKNVCTYIDLVAAGTVDEHIAEALDKKKDLASLVSDNWRQFF